MVRMQAYAAFLILLAVRCESFTATRTLNSHSRSTLSSNDNGKRQLPNNFLYTAQFEPEVGNNVVNNRHSANDFWYNIRTLPGSKVLRDVRNPVLSVFGWSTAVSILHCVLAKKGLAHRLCVSPAVHSFLVSSIGLLLVFRTNSAYQRFNEGRKIWEQILSVSRNLSRVTSLYGKEIGPARRKRMRNLIAAYPYLLRHHIRTGCLCEDQNTIDPENRLRLEQPAVQMIDARYEGDKKCGGSTNPEQCNLTKECWVDRRNMPWSLFSAHTLEKVARVRNRPLWVCDRLGREICDIPYGVNFSNRERQHFMTQVEKLTDAIGKCERIHQTAVPLNYARHSLRTLTIWLFTLPFTLVKELGFLTGPATALIAWLMFGIYQIGHNIEDPFQGSLRLSILCDAIRSDVMGAAIDDNEVEEEAQVLGRDSAYTIEQSSWVDDATSHMPLLPQEILLSTLSTTSAAQLPPPTSSPVFSMEEYKVLEQ